MLIPLQKIAIVILPLHIILYLDYRHLKPVPSPLKLAIKTNIFIHFLKLILNLLSSVRLPLLQTSHCHQEICLFEDGNEVHDQILFYV